MIDFIFSLFTKDNDPVGLISLGLKSKNYNDYYLRKLGQPSKVYAYDFHENSTLKSFAYFG